MRAKQRRGKNKCKEINYTDAAETTSVLFFMVYQVLNKY